jgi:hypothetical protein
VVPVSAPVALAGFTPFRGRSLDPSARTTVYRNLERLPDVVWSVQQRGLVVGHCRAVVLEEVRGHVAAGKVALARRLRQRKVCAWMTGRLARTTPSATGWRRVTFDPFRHDTFVDRETGGPVGASAAVWFDQEGCWYLP